MGRLGLVLTIYGILAVTMTMPAVLVLPTHVIGEGGDPWQTMWRFEEKAEALQFSIFNFQFSNFLADEVFGGGPPRLVNLSVWPWMPLHVWLGQPLAYNVVWLATFVLSGLSMFALVYWLIGQYGAKDARRDLGALFAGLVYMFLPYRVAHAAGHFGAMQTQWLPLVLLFGLLVVERLTVWRVVGLVAVLTLQAWTEHHYALWAVLALGVVWAWRWRRVQELWRSQRLAPYVVLAAGLLFFTVVLPYWPTVRLAQTSTEALALGVTQTERFSADALSYLVPASFHPVWGAATGWLFEERFSGNVAEATQYLGLVPLLLILFFYQRVPRPQRVLWVTLAAVFFVISLGPRLHVFGQALPVPLPYALIDSWPVFEAVRTVARAGVVVGVSLAVLTGWVVATQIRRSGVALVLVGLLLLDFLFMPVRAQSARVSRVYEEVADLSGARILDIPAATNYVAASRALYASGRHGKEVVGSIALERGQAPDALTEARSLPGLRQLLYLRTGHLRQDRTDFFEQGLVETLPDVLRRLDVGGIVVQPDSVSFLQLTSIRDFLSQDMGYQEERFDDALLYRVPLDDTRGDGIFIARDGRWEHVGYDPERASTFGEVAGAAALTIYNVRTQPVVVELTFTLAPGSTRDFAFTYTGGVAETRLDQSGQAHVRVPVAAEAAQPVEVTTGQNARLIIQNPEVAAVLVEQP